MNRPEPLRRLAATHGIASTWHDVFGREHTVPEATLRALLAAMDVAAGSDAEVDAGLREAERAAWRRVLPPVRVVRAGAAAHVEMRAPVALAREPLEVVLEREDGSRASRSLMPAELETVAAVTLDGREHAAWRLPLPEAPPGYHRVALLRRGEPLARLALIVSPGHCHEPAAARDGRVWGPALQLYAVRSRRNWGMGDFTDLETALEQWVARGAAVVGVNPLHALFPHDPARASPYSPSSRLFLDILYLDPERIEDFAECAEARSLAASAPVQTRLAELRAAELVDYPAVAAEKLRLFELLWASFRERHLAANGARAQAFRDFRRRGGRALELHAAYEALQEHFHREDSQVFGWQAWPEPFRDPDSPAVARFCSERRSRIEFYQYLQWQADLQLGRVGARAQALGMGVGLYGDLAVSADRTGAESWANQRLLATGASVGAPPDEFNAAGQNWGLPPLVPGRLVEAAYAPFVALLRAAMRHNGALRIDHVMGLERLYWVPQGASPAEGAYVSYPLDDLLGIVALESQRNSCLVVGEDLGTVSPSVREGMRRHGVLSYRVLLFERAADGAFRAPGEYPAESLATVTTHDLPTLAGFWEGRDLVVRHEHGQFPSEEVRERQIVDRAQARAQLLLALEREGLLPPGVTVDPVSAPAMTLALARALHEYVARSPAKLFLVQLEDVLGAREQANLPGAPDKRHPNWRRKLSRDLESLPQDERFLRFTEDLARVRPAPGPAPRAARPQRATIPRATYRLQLNADFTFRQAADIVPYLAELGVSHVYCSPYFRARPGSTHGYDIVDHNALSPQIGDREDFERFVAVLRAHGLGQILDFVPNHVGVMGADNAWWMDVLENGPASMYAQFFDIDWQPANPALAGKLLVPVLGEQYGIVLERGELEPRFEPEHGALAVHYHEHRFPIDPRDYPRILGRALELLPAEAIGTDGRAEFESLTAAFRNLPGRDESAPQRMSERHRDKEVHKRRLAVLCAANPTLGRAIEAATRELAGTPGDPASFDRLHALLEDQAYRLAYWRVAADEINYRRFFDVNDLAALRMENEAVFEATHRLVLDLIAEGRIDGLRIDHPDGLYDPARYFRRLQERVGALAAPGAEPRPGGLPLYLLVEKITAGFERLPADWPVHGTTGYRFANVVSGLFVDAGAKARLDRAYRAFLGEPVEWEDTAYGAKRLIVSTSLAAELTLLANQLVRIARADRGTRDFTYNTLRQALAEIVACFPVYRTYVSAAVSAEDRRYIDWAVAAARRRAAGTDAVVFDFVRSVLLGEGPAGREPLAAQARTFVMRFQQVTAPVTAKGVEDTALYRFNRLVSLNEVGGEPEAFGTSVRAFHADAQYRARHWPHEMLATSTHDTKRSEDVRARIDVLSELPPGEWRRTVSRWSRMNRSRKREVDGAPAPSPNDEYLLYQTLVGSLPLDEPDEAGWDAFRARIGAYMAKAAREAKQRTSWANPRAEYEEALGQFVHGVLERREGNLFLGDLSALVRRIARFGLINSLAQTLCKLTAPGVPDIYQGNEIWDFSLVDPDNRRPVDYARRRRMLDELRGLGDLPEAALAAEVRRLADALPDGRAKLYVISRALALRRSREALFAEGAYEPLRAVGTHAAHVCAYARRHDACCAVIVVPRLCVRLLGDRDGLPLGAGVWADTAVELPRSRIPGELRGVLDGARIAPRQRGGKAVIELAQALAHFPVGLLVSAAAAEESGK